MDTERREGVGRKEPRRRESQEPHVEDMDGWNRFDGDCAARLAGIWQPSFVVLPLLPHGAFPSFCRLHITFFSYSHTRHNPLYLPLLLLLPGMEPALHVLGSVGWET